MLLAPRKSSERLGPSPVSHRTAPRPAPTWVLALAAIPRRAEVLARIAIVAYETNVDVGPVPTDGEATFTAGACRGGRHHAGADEDGQRERGSSEQFADGFVYGSFPLDDVLGPGGSSSPCPIGDPTYASPIILSGRDAPGSALLSDQARRLAPATLGFKLPDPGRLGRPLIMCATPARSTARAVNGFGRTWSRDDGRGRSVEPPASRPSPGPSRLPFNDIPLSFQPKHSRALPRCDPTGSEREQTGIPGRGR